MVFSIHLQASKSYHVITGKAIEMKEASWRLFFLSVRVPTFSFRVMRRDVP